ncbi:MAG: hypothetical protein E7124_05500 [Bacteroidales bacterium]|nr:hypothetical protein [Bacteroidales bacterium]
MKKLSIMMAALLVAMTGCQKEPVGTETHNAEAVGYVALKISLPSTEGTKADTPFEDGIANEYKVNDVTVVFYDNTGNYAYHTGVSAKPWDMNGTTTDNITVSGKTPAIKITNPAVAQALVLVNVDGVITDFDKPYEDLNAELAASVETLIGAGKNDFFMSNAPYYNGDKFTTLVPVTLAANETEALEDAANIKVERATAKVQVVYDNADPDFTTVGRGTAKITGWNLDVTNKSFYPVRKGLDKDLNGWFAGSPLAAVNEGLLGASRIYMAVDPNYDAAVTSPDASKFNYNVNTFGLQNNGIEYCLENTFAINAQNETQTTRVLLKATYTPEGLTEGETWFQVGTGKTIMSIDDFAQYVVIKANEADLTATELEVKGLPFVAGNCNALTFKTTTLEDLVGDVICYLDGVCYYPVKVRHFTTDELGYANEEAFQTSFKNSGYVAKDLGRYGVLRNTWYKITVNSISNPGSAEIPETTDTPDDKYEQFVACTIDVLAWSVRTHGVDL